jgi:hypothetical protein
MKIDLEKLRCKSCDYERILDGEFIKAISGSIGPGNQHLSSSDIEQNLSKFQ